MPLAPNCFTTRKNFGARSVSQSRERHSIRQSHSGCDKINPPAQRVSSSGCATITSALVMVIYFLFFGSLNTPAFNLQSDHHLNQVNEFKTAFKRTDRTEIAESPAPAKTNNSFLVLSFHTVSVGNTTLSTNPTFSSGNSGANNGSVFGVRARMTSGFSLSNTTAPAQYLFPLLSSFGSMYETPNDDKIGRAH